MSLYKWLMTTTIMVGIQNSVLVLESSNSYKVHETLKGTDPQSIEFDPLNPRPRILWILFPVRMMLCLLQLVP
jgi:hypothetical protein